MSLRDALHAEREASKKGPDCGVSIVLARVDKADRDALLAFLADREVPATAISRALKAEGHNVGHAAVQRHRKGQCRCES